MKKSRFAAVVVLLVGFGLLAGCVGDPDALSDQYDQAQKRALRAGQTAVALQDWMQATQAAGQYATAAAGQQAAERTQAAANTAVVATAQAQGTKTAVAQATSSAVADLVLRATLAAGSTMSALDAEQKALDLRAQQDAVEYQKRLYEEQLKREEVATRNQQWGETAKAAFSLTLSRIIPALGLLGLLYLLVLWGDREIRRRSRRAQVIERGAHGLLPAVIDPQTGEIHVLDRQFWDRSKAGQPPIDYQAGLNDGLTRVQGVAALAAGGRAPSVKSVANIMSNTLTPSPSPEGEGEEIFNAEWRELESWRGGPLPLGMGPKGLITASNSLAPHLMFLGTTGSGKTRCGIRPVVTAALSDGYQAVILDRSGVDYTVFDGHPNCAVVRMDDPASVLGYLAAVYGELQKRLRAMASERRNLWEQWQGAPRLLVVLDEISSLAQELSGKERETLWQRMRMISAEGRKAGITMIMALQDSTVRSIDAPTKRNSTRIVFRVVDGEASRIFLGTDGAERLPPGYFLTVVGDLVRGRGFAPSDAEIDAFLRSRPRAALPKPGWIDGEGTLTPSPSPTERGEDQRIVDLFEQGMSMNEIQMEVFGYTGGAAYQAVKAAISSTTTQRWGDGGGTGSSTGSSSTEDPHPNPLPKGEGDYNEEEL